MTDSAKTAKTGVLARAAAALGATRKAPPLSEMGKSTQTNPISTPTQGKTGTKGKPLAIDTTILQPFVWPDPEVCTERDLFMRLHGPAGLSVDRGIIEFEKGAHVQFDTYFNLFNIGKWLTHCRLEELGLQLTGTGRIEVVIFRTFPNKSWERLINQVVDLDPVHPTRVEFDFEEFDPEPSVFFFEFRTLTTGTLTGAAWDTRQKPRRTPELALSCTTFRREVAVRRVVDRFEKFVTRSRLGDHIRMIVVDNGSSAGIESTDKVTAINNKNYGGAGGFARGLIAARDLGATHCLFMDDDATTPYDALERTWMFLAYAIDDSTAVAGAMISTRHAWALWENGATFDQACRPLHGGTDLRDARQVFDVEYASTPRRPDNFYGGWWYFAFPIDKVKHLPFPFFVRGDDVSFSLVHDFNIVTLAGVVSFQESFTEKDSPLTWYLDLRSHLAHHLSLPSMDIGRMATLRIAVWFWMRTLLTCHYETMAAVNIAFEDVMRGPEFFADNADMSTRRPQIGKLRSAEAWKDGAPPPEKRRFDPHNRWHRTFFKLTLNGHLLPFFKHWGNRVTLPAEARWNIREAWGTARFTYFDADKGKMYTVVHSKTAALREGWTMLRHSLRFWREYDALKARWQEAYPRLTTDTFWAETLELGSPEAAKTTVPVQAPDPQPETPASQAEVKVATAKA